MSSFFFFAFCREGLPREWAVTLLWLLLCSLFWTGWGHNWTWTLCKQSHHNSVAAWRPGEPTMAGRKPIHNGGGWGSGPDRMLREGSAEMESTDVETQLGQSSSLLSFQSWTCIGAEPEAWGRRCGRYASTAPALRPLVSGWGLPAVHRTGWIGSLSHNWWESNGMKLCVLIDLFSSLLIGDSREPVFFSIWSSTGQISLEFLKSKMQMCHLCAKYCIPPFFPSLDEFMLFWKSILLTGPLFTR